MSTAVMTETQQIEELHEQIRRLEIAIETKSDRIGELEEGLGGMAAMEEALKLFADHANWQGTNFKPVMFSDRTDSPWEIADKALN